MNAIMLGGILIGDTFRLSKYIQDLNKQAAEERWDDRMFCGISDDYNFEAVEVMTEDSSIGLNSNILIPNQPRVHFSWVDYENFARAEATNKLIKACTESFYPTIEDLHHPLTRFKYQPKDVIYKDELINMLPEKYIVVQPQTHMGFKDIMSLFQVKFPLPVINIGSSEDKAHIHGSIVLNGTSLRLVAYIISKAQIVVGVDSWANQFAAQVGIKSIKVHFGDWEFDNRSVRELGGIDLLEPEAKEIEEAIGILLF